jgi:hypothetical protein
MSRKAVSTLAVVPLLVMAASACSRGYAALPPAQVCASAETLGRIRQALFEQAASQASSETRYALEELKPQVQARLVRPLVESYDHDTRKTTCTADLDVWLPAGVASPRELQGAIRYDAQPTADGRDVAFEVSGEETLAARIAGADLSVWADAHAPRKPGLVVEVVPRSAAPSTLAERQEPSAPSAAGPSPRRVLAASAATPAAPAPIPVAPAPPRRDHVAARPETEADAEGAVRVFVHVAGPDQLGFADQARAELARLQVNGAPVGAPPIRFVAATPRRTEVRCLKRADCRAARDIAADLSARFGRPISVVDLSSTYGDDPGVRPGSLELWLPGSGGRNPQ